MLSLIVIHFPRRFDLNWKPVGHTQAFLDNAKVFVKDKIVQQNYELIKPF